MRRTASEIINDLEVRIAQLEKQSIFGLFEDKKKTKDDGISIASEERLIEQFIKSSKGVFDVSVDLSNKKKITMDVNFHGVDFHFVGECTQDLEKIYSGSRTANPASLFLMSRRPSSRSRSRRRTQFVGNIYRFQCEGTGLAVYTEFGRIFGGSRKEIYETMRGLLSKRVQEGDRKKQQALEEEERQRSERVRVNRRKRRLQKRDTASQVKKQKRKRDWG